MKPDLGTDQGARFLPYQVRLIVWSLFFASLTGFVVAGLQSSLVAYAIAFYPLIAACLARLAGHNEAIINRLKTYLLDFEDWHAVGYEHYALSCYDRSGSQNKVLSVRLCHIVTSESSPHRS